MKGILILVSMFAVKAFADTPNVKVMNLAGEYKVQDRTVSCARAPSRYNITNGNGQPAVACAATATDGKPVYLECDALDRAYYSSCMSEIQSASAAAAMVHTEFNRHWADLMTAIRGAYKDLLQDPEFRRMMIQELRSQEAASR